MDISVEFLLLFKNVPFLVLWVERVPLLFFATQLQQVAPLSSLGNECPLLENPLITNSGSIGLVTPQAQ